jgi:hypothetical protein
LYRERESEIKMDAQFASFARQQRGSLLPIRRKAEEDWKSLAECDRKCSLLFRVLMGRRVVWST